jgi:hypothetical protein
MRAGGGRPSAEKQDTFACSATDFDAAYLEARKYGVDARPRRIFHSGGKVVDAGYWADDGGARRIVGRLVHPDYDVAALRIGESNNFAKQMVAGIRREIATRRPRVGPTTLTGKLSFKLNELALVDSVNSQLYYIVRSNLVNILVDQFAFPCSAGSGLFVISAPETLSND